MVDERYAVSPLGLHNRGCGTGDKKGPLGRVEVQIPTQAGLCFVPLWFLFILSHGVLRSGIGTLFVREDFLCSAVRRIFWMQEKVLFVNAGWIYQQGFTLSLTSSADGM